MHPAASVIFFTVTSGAGFGMLALIGLLGAFKRLPSDPIAGIVLLGIGVILVTAGLLSSTAHLGQPTRAWRAFSQWRSSWLSREGVLAVATFAPVLLVGWLWIIVGDTESAMWRAGGAALAVLSILTIYATAMIYCSLKPIPAWSNQWTVPGYLSLGLASGAMVLSAALAALGHPSIELIGASVLFIVIGAYVKITYWRRLAVGFPVPGRGHATGLEKLGNARPFEDPHSSENYLLKEMGYRVARKHADKIRRVSLLLGFAVPGAAATLALVLNGIDLAVGILALIGATAMMAGLIGERWLFFAEARHVVTLYYRESAENR